MKSNFNKFPSIQMPDTDACLLGWEAIGRHLTEHLKSRSQARQVLVVECYHGADESQIADHLQHGLQATRVFQAQSAYYPPSYIEAMVADDVTEDRIFGRMSKRELNELLDPEALRELRDQIDFVSEGIILVVGIGASLIQATWDVLIYADMARWEIQQRMRRHEVNSIGLHNKDSDPMRLYKQGYFLDWRMCDRLKQEGMADWDFVLDTNKADAPKMISGPSLQSGLERTTSQPFSLAPFFDPGPWGGQWMKSVCQLDPDQANYAWCFNCVPEENSLLLRFGDTLFETPAINLVFFQTEALLGTDVMQRFGKEFPIRFDFLDTMGGGNLSLQVHPTNSYIRSQFGMSYTQDESYYFLDAAPGARSYLGLKNDVVPDAMVEALQVAQQGEAPFEADQHVAVWQVQKHDHHLIPAGTVHCQGQNSMVLEISATPYIFTFKLWDWGRLGLDGKPRPINIAHGAEVIAWDRIADWTQENLINQIEILSSSDGCREERTGLHGSQFIETRRHWFSRTVAHDTRGTVHVLNLVEGRTALVESPDQAFSPFEVHYAETFVVPASIGPYTIRPFGESEGREIATIKAYVRKP